MLAPPRILDRAFYGNPLGAWLLAVAVLLGVWLALVVARHLLVRRLARTAPRTATTIDDLVLGALRRTSLLFLLVVALNTAAHVALVLPARVTAGLELLTTLVLLLQGASWGTGAITFWLEQMTRRRAQQDQASLTTINFLGIVARIVLFALILLIALDALGIHVTTLLTTLGIAGVAVALAVQNVLGDLFASLSIALDKPFVIGDTITVDQFTGTVLDIGLKTTRLRALSGEMLVFSNADLLKSRIRNYRGQAERRVVFTVGLTYDTTAAQAEQVPTLIREIVVAQPQVRFDRAHLSALGDSALQFETVYYVTSGDYAAFMDTQQRIYLALLRRLEDAGLQLAFPTRTVLLVTPERAHDEDGDRRTEREGVREGRSAGGQEET